MLHLSLSPCTGYRLQLASSSKHLCLHIEQPQAQHPTSTHWWQSTSPPEVWDLLVSYASWYHHREAQNYFLEHSRSPFLAGGMIFLSISGILDPSTFKQHLKTHLFRHYLTYIYCISLFIPSLASLYLFAQCLRLGITSTSSVCLPL